MPSTVWFIGLVSSIENQQEIAREPHAGINYKCQKITMKRMAGLNAASL
jgi:hypothetical protein